MDLYKRITGTLYSLTKPLVKHAWKPGPQTQLLVSRLNALNDGDLIVMIAPPNPYRCPPGPYERVSMFAHVLSPSWK